MLRRASDCASSSSLREIRIGCIPSSAVAVIKECLKDNDKFILCENKGRSLEVKLTESGFISEFKNDRLNQGREPELILNGQESDELNEYYRSSVRESNTTFYRSVVNEVLRRCDFAFPYRGNLGLITSVEPERQVAIFDKQPVPFSEAYRCVNPESSSTGRAHIWSGQAWAEYAREQGWQRGYGESSRDGDVEVFYFKKTCCLCGISAQQVENLAENCPIVNDHPLGSSNSIRRISTRVPTSLGLQSVSAKEYREWVNTESVLNAWVSDA